MKALFGRRAKRYRCANLFAAFSAEIDRPIRRNTVCEFPIGIIPLPVSLNWANIPDREFSMSRQRP
ncbi:hypothetical protein [Pandoraea sp. CB10b_02]|uniref:hypothetical protein n=1 Tax=Pandoraea sp. CB10b_02 TaxID=2014535 RepID=UPI0025809C1E|nr:hypothetical protein [Pandoraea sp. CB10b_02]